MRHYTMLAVNLAASAAIMYFVMFVMIAGADDFYHNINTFYMALMMVAPMGSLMLLTMRSMYGNGKLNFGLHVAFVGAFAAGFAFIREQAFVGNVQFVRSMVPHHSGAVLMCRDAGIADAELEILCEQIIRSQQEEIEQMKRILLRLESVR